MWNMTQHDRAKILQIGKIKIYEKLQNCIKNENGTKMLVIYTNFPLKVRLQQLYTTI